MRPFPPLRVRDTNEAPVRGGGDFVLYWMIAYRRPFWNYSLERAVDWALELGKPLVILEALRCDYPWASDRLHRFILDGMGDQATHFNRKNVTYYPYAEQAKGRRKGPPLCPIEKGMCHRDRRFSLLLSTSDGGCGGIPAWSETGTGGFKRPPAHAGGKSSFPKRLHVPSFPSEDPSFPPL